MSWWHWWQVLSHATELILGFSFRVSLEVRSSGSLVSIQLQSPGCQVHSSSIWATLWGCVLCSESMSCFSGIHIKALAGCRSISLRVLLPLVSMCQWVLCNQN